MSWYAPGVERPWKGLLWSVLDDAGVTCRNGRVRVPYRAPDGEEHNAKIVLPDGGTWWETKGLEMLPFGLETISAELGRGRRGEAVDDVALIVAEGESDCLAIREAFAAALPGAPVRAHRTIALPGAHTWRPAWRRYLDPYALIYLVGDGDKAGRAMMDAVCADVPWARPVLLPDGADARRLLQVNGPRALDRHLDIADHLALLWYGLRRAGSIDELEAILRGEPAAIAAASNRTGERLSAPA